nr:marine proteobacterial sortase target protein [uncultured Cohaesibacter sp.]
MTLPDTNSKDRKRKRHSINVNSRDKGEKSVTRIFKVWIGAYALIVGAALAIATGNPAHSAPAPTPAITAAPTEAPQLITPNDMQSGGLLFQTRQEGKYIVAPKVATDIEIDVSGPVARAIVTQKFINPSDAWVEGIYVFPLPDDAAVDQLRMKIGDRIIEGKIKPKDEARQIYETAKREGKKASLLEQQRPNLFTNAVANIGPNEAVTVQIEYQQTIARKDEEFSLRVPLVVAPRYNPLAKPLKPVMDLKANQTDNNTNGWSTTDPVPDRDKITAPLLDPEKEGKSNPVTLSVHLKAGFPLDNVVSHYHDVLVKPEGGDMMTLSLKKEAVPADKDFLLTWTGKPSETPNLGLFSQSLDQTPGEQATGEAETQNAQAQDAEAEQAESDDEEKTGIKGDGDQYLLAYITPPYKLAKDLKLPPREVIFVIDQSGSMDGPSIQQARESLIEALGQLKPEDSFQIIRFNDQMEQLFSAPQPADKEHLSTARYWVAATQAGGGTEMLPAMQAALADHNPNAATLRQVIFLTDGAIGNERQLFETVKQQKGRSRIFTVGIGSAPNSFFMSRAAEVGRGTFTHIGDITEVKSQMARLFTQLTTPVATDLSIEFANGKDIEASPSELPDLYKGEPVVVAFKGKDLGSELTLKGRFDDQPWSMTVDISKAAPSGAVDKLWARGKIRQLENERLLASDPAAIDKAIENLGLSHHLVTRLTSLVAVDVTPTRPDGETLESQKVPLNLPDGWNLESRLDGLESVDNLIQPSAAPMRALKRPSLFSAPALEAMATSPVPNGGSVKVASVASSGGSQIMLPKTATPASLLILAGIALLTLAGALIAFLQWRKISPALR